MNPDGVILGNYRCSLSGCDLNRRWSNPNRELHPEVYYAKQMITQLTNVKLVIDLHGHNIKKGFFMYGCTLDGVQIPYNLSLLNNNFFLTKCCFKIAKSKLSTARVALWKELKINNVFTLESSFYGNHSRSFQLDDYRQMGRDIGRMLGLSKFLQIKEMPTFEDDSEGSDSQPSEDNLSQNDIEVMLDKKIKERKQNRRKDKSVNLPKIGKQSRSLDYGTNQKIEMRSEFTSERKVQRDMVNNTNMQQQYRSRQPTEKKHYTEIPVKLFDGNRLFPLDEESKEKKGLKQLLQQKNKYNMKMFLFQQQPFQLRKRSLYD